MAKKLKDCPFCGSEAECYIDDDWYWEYRVCCSNKNCILGDGSTFKSEEEAIAAWNRRDLEEEHREQLVQELEDLKRVQGDPSTKYGIQLAIGKIKEQAQ